MIAWSPPVTHHIGNGSITMRKSMYMGIAIIHERTNWDHRDTSQGRFNDKYYPEYARIRSGKPRCPHFHTEQELINAIHDYQRANGRIVWPVKVTSLRPH